jgi:hypothetical protein
MKEEGKYEEVRKSISPSILEGILFSNTYIAVS